MDTPTAPFCPYCGDRMRLKPSKQRVFDEATGRATEWVSWSARCPRWYHRFLIAPHEWIGGRWLKFDD
jgi:hypothetical protein